MTSLNRREFLAHMAVGAAAGAAWTSPGKAADPSASPAPTGPSYFFGNAPTPRLPSRRPSRLTIRR